MYDAGKGLDDAVKLYVKGTGGCGWLCSVGVS